MKQIQIGGIFLAAHPPGEQALSHRSVVSVLISENQWFNRVI
jgi:hypothetical protein